MVLQGPAKKKPAFRRANASRREPDLMRLVARSVGLNRPPPERVVKGIVLRAMLRIGAPARNARAGGARPKKLGFEARSPEGCGELFAVFRSNSDFFHRIAPCVGSD